MFAVTGYSSDGFSVVLPGYNFHLTVVCCPVWRSFQVLFKGCFFKISNLCMEQKFRFTLVVLCFKTMQIDVIT